MAEQKTKQINLKVEFPKDDSRVHYSNLALITHMPEEFIINFAQVLPGKNTADVIAQVVMSPRNAKNLMNSLAVNIKKYEDQFGEIPMQNLPQTNIDPIGGVQ